MSDSMTPRDHEVPATIWIAVGAPVDRELDDLAGIWGSATIVAVRADGLSVDLEYIDGNHETDVSVEELRPHVVDEEDPTGCISDETSSPKYAVATLSAASQVQTDDSTIKTSAEPGLTARIKKVRVETLCLARRVVTLRHSIPLALSSLYTACTALQETTARLSYPFIQVLDQLRQDRQHAVQDTFELTNVVATSSVVAKQRSRYSVVDPVAPGGFSYMLPVTKKSRGVLERESSTHRVASGLPDLRSRIHEMPNNRVSAKRTWEQTPAMLLDIGSSSKTLQPAASTPELARVIKIGPKASHSTGHLAKSRQSTRSIVLPALPAVALPDLDSFGHSCLRSRHYRAGTASAM